MTRVRARGTVGSSDGGQLGDQSSHLAGGGCGEDRVLKGKSIKFDQKLFNVQPFEDLLRFACRVRWKRSVQTVRLTFPGTHPPLKNRETQGGRMMQYIEQVPPCMAVYLKERCSDYK